MVIKNGGCIEFKRKPDVNSHEIVEHILAYHQGSRRRENGIDIDSEQNMVCTDFGKTADRNSTRNQMCGISETDVVGSVQCIAETLLEHQYQVMAISRSHRRIATLNARIIQIRKIWKDMDNADPTFTRYFQ